LLLVKFFFIFWYGVIWLSPEDLGESIAFYVSRAYGEKLEKYNENPDEWKSPTNTYPSIDDPLVALAPLFGYGSLI